uniref:AAA+ ATPase domain-containing protein n=1 Tax=Pseudo-nitzschia australis TaxID=44445 RepID=A0A7S4ARS4_9STRA|mmetsp:Transcript_2467/g.5379  ORF Transcript_2467/g.5379 Transcript_2467/m.5379 type:complete len:944 (+) Transcript_2467:130-2961(+)
MSISCRNLSLLRRQIARRDLTASSSTSTSRSTSTFFRRRYNYYDHRANENPLAAALVSSVTELDRRDTTSTRSFSSKPTTTQPSFATTSTRIDDILRIPTWLIPRKGTGFDNFLKRDKQDADENEDADSNKEEGGGKGSGSSSSSSNEKETVENEDDNTTTKEKKTDETETMFGSSARAKYTDNNTRNNSEGGNGGNGLPPNFTGASLVATLMLVAFTYFMLRNDGDDIDGVASASTDFSREITWNDFCNYLLETGQVEKIVVTNNRTMAKVFLKRGSHGLPQHQNRRFRQGGAGAAGRGSANNQIFDDSTTRIAADTSSSTADDFGGMQTLGKGISSFSTNQQQHQIVYRFAIGSVDSFEKKLEEAQKAVGIDPIDEIPVQYTNETTTKSEILSVLPSLVLMGAAFYFMRFAAGSMGGGMGGSGGGGGGMGGMFQVGKSTHKKIKPEDVKINFSDVAGCDEAKKEIVEFVDFLQSPEQFTKLGAKIPKGALLCGPPGTGKTLLAKAVAGEAGVPFFSISGSDFIEMFVGVGPSRVRDLFKEARENAPCIIFIDEIDAVGRQRGRGGAGGNDERENTLNQMLVEMDGFDTKSGVVVLAGTNRVDILDQALTRPGRFDRQITVDRPDIKGRKAIFKVHLKGITLKDPVDDVAGRLAGLTPGFAGADIANICNEAAIVAARRKADSVSMDDFEKATDRIIGGLESNKIMSDEERSIVAYHEAGHAIAGWFLEHADPLLKVTIIPRTSGALGFAQYLPKEVNLRTQEEIMDIVCMALAGRAAEEIFFGRVTTGASDDLRRVTDLVYSTIQLYGMNPRLGQLAFPKDDNAMFDERQYSEKTAKAMDEEARFIVDEAYQRTLNLLTERKNEVESVAKLLLERETIVHDDVHELVGPRPFKGDPQYEEFVRRHREKENESSGDTNESSSTDSSKPEGSISPGLAFQNSK